MEKLPLSQVIAQAVIDAKVSVCTHVPGYGGTETFRAYQELVRKEVPYSFHEEVAYTIAHAAGLVGSRSACLIKTHGFAKAANSILSSISSGSLGGVIVFAFDDPQGSHSDNIFDAHAFIRGSGIPYERLSLENAYEQILAAYEKSEDLALPYALIVDTDQIQERVSLQRKTIAWSAPGFQSRPHFNVVCPPMSSFQKQVLDLKLSGKKNWKELQTPKLSIPEALPGTLKETAEKYAPVFETFKNVVRECNEGSVVSADAGTSGLFAFAPYYCVDFLTYMGGSTALALGTKLAGFANSWAVSGDFSFISAATLGLLEAELRRVPLKVIILNNQKAAATGNQIVDERALELALKPYADRVRPLTAKGSLKDAFAEAQRSTETRILLIQI